LFKYAERLLQHWAALEYWILVALVRDDAQRRGLLRRFGDKVVLNDDNIDILEVADFEESVASFCEKKGDVKFISGNEKYADFLDVDALANKIREKNTIASDALRGGKLVLVDGNVAEKNKGNDLCARWPAVALTFPEDAETIKATMKKFGRFGKTFSSIVSTREVFVCYFNRNKRRCEWVHENKVSDIFSEVIEDELETKKRRRETFGEDEERKKAFEGANLCRREMEKIIKNGKNTRDDADDTEDGDDNNNNNNNKNKNDTLCNSMKGDGAVGMRVDVFWPKEKKYYRGIVNSFDADSQRHHVIYDDGDEEKALNFEKEKILLPLWGISKKIKLDRRGGYKRAHPN
jgi:hypothetical protein